MADAPGTARAGVGDSDAEHLEIAFGTTTVRDLGADEDFLRAQAVAELAD